VRVGVEVGVEVEVEVEAEVADAPPFLTAAGRDSERATQLSVRLGQAVIWLCSSL
jgi:hypothetical protein